MKLTKPLTMSPVYLTRITKGLERYLWQTTFEPIFNLLKSNTILNSKNDLINAINSGKIFYSNGAFRSLKPFSNTVANELEKIGARFKYGAYYIPENSIPLEVSQIISFVKTREATKIIALGKLFDDFSKGLFDVPLKPFIEKSVDLACQKIEREIISEMINHSVPVIDLGLVTPKVKISRAKQKEVEEYWKNLKKEQEKAAKDAKAKEEKPKEEPITPKTDEGKPPVEAPPSDVTPPAGEEPKTDQPPKTDEEVVDTLKETVEETVAQPPSLDVNLDDVDIDYKSKMIAEDYIYNMDYWVQNWKVKNIIKMRKEVLNMYQQGKRLPQIQEYFEQRWGIAKNKAKFLAENELGLVSSTVQKATWTEAGASKFKWIRSVSKEKRCLHEKYYNKVFEFDNPPIIDEKLGIKGLPNQIWNCKCRMQIVVPTLQEQMKARNVKRNIIKKISNAFTSEQCRYSAWRYRRFGQGQEV